MGDAMQAATFTAVGILVVLLCLFEPPWLPVLLGLAPAGVLPW